MQAEQILKLLGDESPPVRAWAIQTALETSSSAKRDAAVVMPAVLQRLSELATNDPSPQVRLYLASALQRLPLADRWSILEPLVSHAEDATDHNLPLMYWYAAEPLAELDPQRALAWALVAGQNVPLVQQHMIRRIGSGAPEKSLALLIEGLTKAQTPELQSTFLRGLNEALRGRTRVEAPAGWTNVAPQLMSAQQPEVRLEALSLGATFGDSVAKTRLRELIADDKQAVKERRTALTALLKTKDQELSTVLRRLLANAELRGDALRALAAYDDPQTPAAIVEVYRNLGPSEQRDALATLSARVPYAQALFRAVEQRQIPAGHLTADLIRQLRNLKSDELNAVIERVWGTARESTADKAQLIEQYKTLVTTVGSVKPDLELGRAIFAKTCQQCHSLFATGGKVGPDLTGSNRANLDYILSNVLDPSAVMAKEYQPSVIVTNGGRVITGIVKEAGKDALTVQTVNELVIVPLADIDERKTSDKSMMPDDLLKQLGPREVRSLIAYLASPGQVPILATSDNVPSFFNGRDLAGWRGDEHLWRVENGEIIGRSPGIKHNDFLVSEMSVGDFKLSFEVKLVPNAGNSGVQFRSEPQANGEVKGYQADVGSGWWGKLYEELGRGLLWKKSGDEHVRVDDWNRYEIQAVGSRIQTWINGQLCVDLDDPCGARRGVIALQLHSGGPFEVRYRKLSLSLLKANGGAVTAAQIPQSLGGPATTPLSFKKQQLDAKFRSEGVAYGDFNNDGQLDIAAGSVWFEAPQWKPHSILEQPKEFSIRTYSDTFCNWAEDLDGDGYQDLIVVDFPGNPTWWFRNPGRADRPWQRSRVTPVTNNESPNYLDVDRDGRRELLLGYSEGNLGVARPGTTATADWVLSSVSGSKAPGTDKFSHGLGVGDLNLDGRDDLLVTAGWGEAPSKPTKEPWKFHPAPFGQPAAQMYVFDFDGDGDQDVLSSSAHKAGIWWHEQTAPDQWKTHEIDASIAQTHALVLADMNGDGLPDFVTGKRFYAHNGNDPGEDQPATLFWYELSRENGKPKWTPHQIDHDSGVGTQFEVVDMNRDGLLDVIISNKKGVFYFEQTRATATAKEGR
ncbi:MAG: family 16 glycoside hydrolase [Planctomycetota bacterium]